MDGYRGTIVCDALKTHEAGARGNDAIALAGCWAHVYRKFEEAAPDHPEAQLALKWIGELYAIDERAEGDLERRAELRRTESAAVIGAMKTWLPRRSVKTGQRETLRSTSHLQRKPSVTDGVDAAAAA